MAANNCQFVRRAQEIVEAQATLRFQLQLLHRRHRFKPTQTPRASPRRLRTTIPSTQPPGADPPYRPGYIEEWSAPKHPTKGNAMVFQDIFTPETVQRGFDPRPLAHQRNMSELTLFDRKDDKWQQWHSKYPSPEKNPISTKYEGVDLVSWETSIRCGGPGTGCGMSFYATLQV